VYHVLLRHWTPRHPPRARSCFPNCRHGEVDAGFTSRTYIHTHTFILYCAVGYLRLLRCFSEGLALRRLPSISAPHPSNGFFSLVRLTKTARHCAGLLIFCTLACRSCRYVCAATIPARVLFAFRLFLPPHLNALLCPRQVCGACPSTSAACEEKSGSELVGLSHLSHLRS
jgi:hypothetical protein